MSESGTSTQSRYQRSTGGLLAAMVVTVVAVVAFAGLNALNGTKAATPVPAIDYTAMMRSGRADHKLLVMAPTSLPAGWKATSADYGTGSDPTWHLGMLTGKKQYVGVEEALGGLQDLVDEHVDSAATPGKDVVIGGQTWQTWTDKNGDYAVGRSLRTGSGPYESWVVVGTAPAATIREFAGGLKGGHLHLAG